MFYVDECEEDFENLFLNGDGHLRLVDHELGTHLMNERKQVRHDVIQ